MLTAAPTKFSRFFSLQAATGLSMPREQFIGCYQHGFSALTLTAPTAFSSFIVGCLKEHGKPIEFSTFQPRY
jgi:hypothetical protein